MCIMIDWGALGCFESAAQGDYFKEKVVEEDIEKVKIFVCLRFIII